MAEWSKRSRRRGEGDSKTQEGEKRVIHSSNIQDQFRHTNSQNTFQEIEMTVCEYGLRLLCSNKVNLG